MGLISQLGFSVTLLLVVSFCYCYDKSVEVNGVVECTECTLDNAESSSVLSGRQVAISCRAEDGKLETRGVGNIKEEGKFKVELPSEVIGDDGKLKQECFAQLQTAESNTACPSSEDSLEASKIIVESSDNGKHTLGLKGNLEFSPTACTSALYSKYFHKHPLVKKFFKKPFLPPIHKFKPPIIHKPYKKPFPPSDPIHKPKDSVPSDEPEFTTTSDNQDPLMDDNHWLPYHKKYLPHFHKYYKPIPKIPIVHKKPPIDLPDHDFHKYKPIPKIPYDPFHKYHDHHGPVIPPELHA